MLTLFIALSLAPSWAEEPPAPAIDIEEPDSPPAKDRRMRRPNQGGNELMQVVHAAGPDAQIAIEPIESGVSVKITSKDPKIAARIKKAGEIARLSRELNEDMEKDAPVPPPGRKPRGR